MDDDERQVELDCISAIFPEIVLDPNNPFSASIDLPVNPRNPVKVSFPPSAEGLLPTPPQSETSGENGEAVVNLTDNLESHNLSYLPSLRLRITLPEGYPADCAPKFELATSPEWLSRSHLIELESNGERMWEESGHTEVVFGYIDSLQQAAENAFGLGEGNSLQIPQELKISLLDFDIKATQAAFDKETFDCGICLDPKKGSVCHKMIDCGHVFCAQCLQDFYNNAINEGDLVSVRCLDPGCSKKREEAQAKKRRKPRTLSPSELLQIPLEHEMVSRYVKLKHKADLESDKNTVYCPRKWCQGAAISKKHRKPQGLEVVESDDESEAEEASSKKFAPGRDLLSVCEDCSFAFCSRCYSSWHGEFALCIPKKPTGELTEEDKASLEYLKLHTTPCPTCAAPAQKTHGCNHMICFKCNTHFCYLCSAWLSPGNPYEHYNTETTPCYMRLWELEGGDGDDVGIGYGGGDRMDHRDPNDEEEEFEDAMGEEPERDMQVQVPPQEVDDVGVRNDDIPAAPVPPQELFQREGPLVFRINQVPAPPPAAPNPPIQPQQNNGRQQRRAPGRNNNLIDARPAGLRQAAPHGGRRRLAPPARAPVENLEAAQEREANHQRWVEMFVQMALNDEEDQLDWDSDDEEDAAAWAIPVR